MDVCMHVCVNSDIDIIGGIFFHAHSGCLHFQQMALLSGSMRSKDFCNFHLFIETYPHKNDKQLI